VATTVTVSDIYMNNMQISDLVLINGYLLQIASYIISISLSAKDFTQSISNLTNLYNFIYVNNNDIDQHTTQPVRVVNGINKHSLNVTSGKIVFQDVNFSYHLNKHIFNHLNFTVPAESFTVLKGGDASGKNTIIDLLLGLYTIQSGKIFIDDQDITLCTSTSIRKNIAIISPLCLLINDTILNNITLYKANIPFSVITEMARELGVYDTIMSTPLGFYTKIGAENVHFSYTETVKIALIRFLLENTQIVVMGGLNHILLDSEGIMIPLLQKYLLNKTVIFISNARLHVPDQGWKPTTQLSI